MLGQQPLGIPYINEKMPDETNPPIENCICNNRVRQAIIRRRTNNPANGWAPRRAQPPERARGNWRYLPALTAPQENNGMLNTVKDELGVVITTLILGSAMAAGGLLMMPPPIPAKPHRSWTNYPVPTASQRPLGGPRAPPTGNASHPLTSNQRRRPENASAYTSP